MAWAQSELMPLAATSLYALDPAMPRLRSSIANDVARYTSMVWLTYVSQVPIWPAAIMAS